MRSIQDLGMRFNLLATNERVDALDARVDSVVERFGWRLMQLEQRVTALDAHVESVTSSIGSRSMALRAHKNNAAAHQPRTNGTTHGPPQHPDTASSLTQHAAGDEHQEISTIGRRYNLVWDQSVMTAAHGDVGTSTFNENTTCSPDSPYVTEDSIASS
ncbi:hypothetical protein F4604DRAFT_1927277 [Suillus subluteus]|nr:hypothetical protein F4604DRAFT_1927277 [Suillus subluteus]